VCGIAGAIETDRSSDTDRLDARGHAMAACLEHRGPDDGGVWSEPATGLVLGHRRLSIIDLSPGGHQPMTSRSGRFVLVFNGEIYNYRELRGDLQRRGVRLRSQSDTEVLLESLAERGLTATLRAARGMFALAVYDRQDRTLSLARDRLGEKPLYYGWSGNTFLFASECSALLAHPDFDATIDRDALTALLRYSFIPAPLSVYRSVAKLLPGTVLVLPLDEPGAMPAPTSYWSLREAAEAGQADPFRGTDQEAVAALDEVLRASVVESTVADVPVGAFLSGGIDSALVCGLMQACASRPVRTYTIGFREPGYDEAAYARAVADHLGTEHTELYVSPTEAQQVIPSLATMYGEPFADASQIPTALVARLARREVTVALSGDGGDEMFAGYARYRTAETRWQQRSRLPAPARLAAAGALRRGSPKSRRIAAMLSAQRPEQLYRQLLTHWADPGAVVLGASEPPDALNDPARVATLPGVVDRLMYLDGVQYLPDAVLAKVDRAAMASSLETRVPLLDVRVVELAWRLPARMRIRDGQSKWVLRQVLDRYVPRALVDRPKMGFGVPVSDWLRGRLRPWAQDLLEPGRLRSQGLLDPVAVRSSWEDHLAGRRDAGQELWNVLMLQTWLDAR
jgi:asparagine synthase (glutamine-hydrolysing)